MPKTTEEDWLKLFYGVIFNGIKYKLRHGEVLAKGQQRIVDRFPDHDWSQYAKDKG